MFRFAVVTSLAVNLVLGATLLWRHTPTPPLPPPAVLEQPAAIAEPPPEPTLTDLGVELLADASSDASYVARLRAVGVPDDVMVVLLRYRLQQRHAARWQAIAAQARAFPYWERTGFNLPVELRQQVRELNREEAAVLTHLLGREIWDNDFTRYAAAPLDFLPPAKRAQLTLLQQDYADLRASITAANLDALLPGDHEVLNLLQREEAAELAALLSPQELADYHQRVGPAAQEVQHVLRRFEATEAEYLQLLALHDEIDATYGPTGTSLPRAERDARREAWNAARQSFIDTLPPERAELWAITQDPSFERVQSFVFQQGLDTTTATDLVRLSRNTQQQADVIRQNSALSESQRALELSALARQARLSIAQTLPPASAEAYLKSWGSWVARLSPGP